MKEALGDALVIIDEYPPSPGKWLNGVACEPGRSGWYERRGEAGFLRRDYWDQTNRVWRLGPPKGKRNIPCANQDLDWRAPACA
jgi:hypothetical protein